MPDETHPKIGHLPTVADFQSHLRTLHLDLPVDPQILSAAQGSPLAAPLDIDGFRVGNRWVAHPMEGWDGTPDGQPTENTLRRWQHFGQSGCKWIWGGEAFAVQSDARANPNQLALIDNDIPRAESGLRSLFNTLVSAHQQSFGSADDLFIGLQLTHSGRFCKPSNKKKLEPRIAYHHPLLDRKFGIAPDDTSVLLSDSDLQRIIDNYITVAKIAQRVGFHFVDIKHCHGYLGHELLSGRTRPGLFGGSLENRTRFARQIIQGIQASCPGLKIGVRLSLFDGPPFHPDATRAAPNRLGPGTPDEVPIPYSCGFGCNPNNPLEIDLAEPIEFVRMLQSMGVRMINATCASPYYNPHFVRPATFPPSDGYSPPEDPLVGVVRQIHAVRAMKQACPQSIFVGTAYTCLQEYLPQVAQAVVRQNWTDAIGIGRLLLSYWELPADTLQGHPFQSRRLCRTFSDCTTAPRNGLFSGCFPLDPHYKESPEHIQLKQAKMAFRKSLTVMRE